MHLHELTTTSICANKIEDTAPLTFVNKFCIMRSDSRFFFPGPNGSRIINGISGFKRIRVLISISPDSRKLRIANCVSDGSVASTFPNLYPKATSPMMSLVTSLK